MYFGREVLHLLTVTHEKEEKQGRDYLVTKIVTVEQLCGKDFSLRSFNFAKEALLVFQLKQSIHVVILCTF